MTGIEYLVGAVGVVVTAMVGVGIFSYLEIERIKAGERDEEADESDEESSQTTPISLTQRRTG